MHLILQKNKENFDSVAGSTREKFFAVILQNQPWPFGLRRNSSLAELKRLFVVPLRITRFALRIDEFRQQQNVKIFRNRA